MLVTVISDMRVRYYTYHLVGRVKVLVEGVGPPGRAILAHTFTLFNVEKQVKLTDGETYELIPSLRDMLATEAHERKIAGGEHGRDSRWLDQNSGHPITTKTDYSNRTDHIIANVVNKSHDTVHRVLKIHREAPDLMATIVSGDIEKGQQQMEPNDFIRVGRMSQADLGRELGISRQRVNQLRRRGLSNLEIAGRLTLRGSGSNTAAVTKPTPAVELGTLRDAQARNQNILAEKTEHDNAVRKAQLVRASDVEARWADLVTRRRDVMLRLPGELRDQLAGMSDSGRIEQVLDAAVRRALEIASTPGRTK